MSSTSEKGHAKNIANFKKLISFCVGCGKDYNPSNEDLAMPALQKTLDQSLANDKSLKNAATVFNRATNARALLFENHKHWATRIINAFSICGADKKAIDDVNGINRKIQGLRAGGGKNDLDEDKSQPDVPLGEASGSEEGKDSNGRHSVSQQSYDMLTDHYDKLLVELEKTPGYKPNEKDIDLAAVQEKVNLMLKLTEELNTADVNWTNRRLDRQEVLYNEETSLVNTALHVKTYIKSLYSAGSAKFKEANKIAFRKII